MAVAACEGLPGSDDSTTDTETGGPVGEGCSDAPVADAGFSLELDGWPATQNSMYDITAACTVSAVEVMGDEIVTTLECDDAGALRPASLHLAATPEGTPSWGPTSSVMLAYRHLEDTELETGLYRSLSLRQADGTFLVAAVDGDTLTLAGGEWLGTTPAQHLDPVVATEDREHCGWVSEVDAVTPMRVTLELDDESVALVSGQRGVLPLGGQTDRLAVDLAEATVGYCCHYTTWFQLLVRRVS
jgi:hypothetical protein